MLVVTENTPSGPHAIGVVTDHDMVLDTVAVSVSPSRACVADMMGWDILNVPLDADLSDTLQGMLSPGVRRANMASNSAPVGVLSLDGVLGAVTIEPELITRLVHIEREHEATGSAQPPLDV